MDSTSLVLLSNAFLLGFRHGIDWDHIAAIMDIVGTTTTTGEIQALGGRAMQLRALFFSFLYGIGHASAVVLLGIAAISFSSLIPPWLNDVTEKVVGITLLLFGVGVIWVLVQSIHGAQELALKSRWMMLFDWARQLLSWLRARLFGTVEPESVRITQYGPFTSFSVGVIHGIGVESGTQVLMIAAITGAASQTLGAMMLASFVLGSVTTNTLVALFGAFGFISSARVRPVYVTVGVLTGLMSLIVGGFLTFGKAECLPKLGCLWGVQENL
jgi:high-affinity nickel-transport protein